MRMFVRDAQAAIVDNITGTKGLLDKILAAESQPLSDTSSQPLASSHGDEFTSMRREPQFSVERLPDGTFRVTMGDRERELLQHVVSTIQEKYGLHPRIVSEMALIYACALFDGLIVDTLQTIM